MLTPCFCQHHTGPWSLTQILSFGKHIMHASSCLCRAQALHKVNQKLKDLEIQNKGLKDALAKSVSLCTLPQHQPLICVVACMLHVKTVYKNACLVTANVSSTLQQLPTLSANAEKNVHSEAGDVSFQALQDSVRCIASRTENAGMHLLCGTQQAQVHLHEQKPMSNSLHSLSTIPLHSATLVYQSLLRA